MDYTKMLEEAIKEREAKKDKIQEYIANLKMQVKQMLTAESTLKEVGYTYSDKLKSVLNKIENININTVSSITEEDKAILTEEYDKSKLLIEEVEGNIKKLLGITTQGTIVNEKPMSTPVPTVDTLVNVSPATDNRDNELGILDLLGGY